MEELRVHQRHTRKLKYCSRGVRQFFKTHGMDYSKFLKEGLPAEEFINTGDAMAIALVEVARGEQ